MAEKTRESQLSRRSFLKGSATLGAGLAALGLMGCAEQPSDEQGPQAFEEGVDWNAEYDVVVLGAGFAGLASAITAAAEGSNVLIVEKGSVEHSGGNSRYAMQMVLTMKPENRDGGLGYLKNIRGAYTTPSDEMLETYVDGIMDLRSWITDLGGDPVVDKFQAVGEFKNVEGWDCVDAWSLNGTYWDAALYNFLARLVEENEHIEVWYETPAREFIQEPTTKVVHGVVVENGGQRYCVRAIDGVVLCTGGFEANQQMTQDFVQLPYCYSKGGQLNEGDGIKMAQAIGADLWHMSTCSGPDLNYIDKKTNRPAYFAFAGHSSAPGHSCGFCTDNSAIIVGAGGSRFHDEATMPGHGFVNFHGMLLRMPQSLPAYCVFDQNAFDTHQVYPAWTDMQAKVDDGTIVKAETASALEKALEVPEGSIAATIERYNFYCEQGIDYEFGRKPEYLIPLSTTGPYYAFEVRPSYTNTQGGPRRDVDGSILDTEGRAIPHLYSAGECGSIWGDVYPGAGNISECLVFGRISGAAAAASKSDNLRTSVMDGKERVSFASVGGESSAQVADDEFVGTGIGIGGEVKVKVSFDGDTITAVEVVSHNETEGIGTNAVEQLPAKIVAANSTDVDVVTGATTTSHAIIDAVNQVLANR